MLGVYNAEARDIKKEVLWHCDLAEMIFLLVMLDMIIAYHHTTPTFHWMQAAQAPELPLVAVEPNRFTWEKASLQAQLGGGVVELGWRQASLMRS